MEFGIPPLPSWPGSHPLIIHLPLGLLPVAPVLILLGLVFQKCGRAYWWSAFTMMAIGTVGAWLAVASGGAAWELAIKSGEVGKVLEHHEALAFLTRIVFTALTLLYLVVLLGPAASKKELSRRANWGIQGPFLLLYAAGLIVLAQAGHEGARAVHEFGALAVL